MPATHRLLRVALFLALAPLTAGASPPVLTGVWPPVVSGHGCCAQGSYQLILRGSNIRKCSSVVLFDSSGIWELLPTPDVSDCNVRRSGSGVSPRERLFNILPPDGETLNCVSRPDLVPLRQTSARTYLHDGICLHPPFPTGSVFFCPGVADMVSAPGDPNDVTSGGAFTWINETEIRLFFGPGFFPGPGEWEELRMFVSNDPGRGFGGEHVSNIVTVVLADNDAIAQPVPVYRLYNPQTMEHLFTTDAFEYTVLGMRGWTQEGIAHRVLRGPGTFEGSETVPLYRLYHAAILQHLWTTDSVERDGLLALGWTYEGVDGWLLRWPTTSSLPLLRLSYYDPPLHLWTTDANEYAVPPWFGWAQEGEVGHVLPVQ